MLTKSSEQHIEAPINRRTSTVHNEHPDLDHNQSRLRVCIDFLPFLLDLLPLQLGFLSVGSCSLQSFCSETHIDILLCFVAATSGLVEKTAGVAFVKDLHDFFTTCGIDTRLAEATGRLNEIAVCTDSPLLFFVCRCGCILE